MQQYLTVQLINTFSHKKLGKALEIEGILLKEGTYTDKSGQTVHYPKEVISAALESFLGVPIVFPHTDEREDVLKVGGFTTQVQMVDDAAIYKGCIYKQELIDKIVNGELNANSIEARVLTEYDPVKQVHIAKHLVGEAIALTNHPACPACVIQSHREVTEVKLEKGGEKKMADEIVPVPLPEESKPKTPEEIVKEIKEVIKDYPMPKTKAWGDMTDQEKYLSCVTFFKNKGYPYPYPTPKKVKDEITGEERWDFPKDFPKELQDLIVNMDKQIADLNKQIEDLKNQLLEKEKQEVSKLVQNIRDIDPEFDAKKYLEGIECPCEQRVMLEKYYDRLKAIAPKFKLEAVKTADNADERLDKICMEAFGVPFSEIAKILGGKQE